MSSAARAALGAAVLILGLRPLALAAGDGAGWAPSAAEFDAGIEAEAGSGEAAYSAEASGSLEWMGPVLAARVSGSGVGSLSAARSEGGGDLSLELSAVAGDLLALVAGRAGLEAATDGAPAWSAGGGLLLSLNGFERSASLAGDLDYVAGEGGGLRASARLGAAILASELVLKAEGEASASWAADGTRSLELRPRLRASWYPGLPFAAKADAGLRRVDYGSGETELFLPLSLSAYGALGRTLLEMSADSVLPLAAGAPAEAEIRAGASFLLWRLRGEAELRLPVGFSWTLAEGASSARASAGLALSL